jgi:hypothetical protein
MIPSIASVGSVVGAPAALIAQPSGIGCLFCSRDNKAAIPGCEWFKGNVLKHFGSDLPKFAEINDS